MFVPFRVIRFLFFGEWPSQFVNCGQIFRVNEDILVVRRKIPRVIPTACVPLPHELLQAVLLAKNLVHQEAEVVNLMVIDADEDDAIFRKQLPCKKKPRIHH